jgi:Fic family protein
MNYQHTSRLAWRAHDVGPVNTAILSTLEEFSEDGLTCEEIETLLGYDHQTVSANISHMLNGTQGTPVLMERTGKKARNSSGRLAHKLRTRCLEPGEVLFVPEKRPRSAKRKGAGGYPDQPGHNGVDTSRMAAEAIAPHVTQLATRLFDLLVEKPRTCQELERLTSLTHQTASARLRELAMKGRIVDTGLRRLTKARRAAVVWRAIVDEG